MEWTIIYIIATVMILPILIYSLISQAKVNSTFDKYSKHFNQNQITASELAHKLLMEAEITDVDIVRINGKLTDCYDSRNKVVKLSDKVFDSTSMAALGIAAHEVGHAIQDAKKNLLFRMRQIIIPVTNFVTRAFIPLLFIGAILNIMFFLPTIGYYITLASVISYGGSLLVYFVTLPLEYDASKKALKLLYNTSLSTDEIKSAKKVLNAAIHTYIAALLTSLAYFLRFLSILMIFYDRD